MSRYSVPADLAGTLRQLSLNTAVLRLAGSGLSLDGSGILRTTHLDPVLMTGSGRMIARTRASEVCSGDRLFCFCS